MSGKNNNGSNLLSMGKRVLGTAPAVVPVSTLEDQFLGSQATGQPSPDEITAAKSDQSLLIQHGVQPDVQRDVQHAIQQYGTASTPEVAPKPLGTRLLTDNRKNPIPTVPATHRLPMPLHARLKRISQFNGIGMSEIVIEALERHLENFPDPGDSWR